METGGLCVSPDEVKIMASMDITLYPDAPLNQTAAPVHENELGPDFERLIEDMYETMDVYVGSGLAAPQVGLAKRFFVLRNPDDEQLMCFVNPVLSNLEGAVVAEEGCLSLPEVYAPVERAERLHIQALNEHGEPIDSDVEGWLARIIQHETDHLDGKVFIDRLDILSREDKAREWAEMRAHIVGAQQQADSPR